MATRNLTPFNPPLRSLFFCSNNTQSMRKGRKVEDIAGLRRLPQTCNIIHYKTLPQQGIFVPEINKMLGEGRVGVELLMDEKLNQTKFRVLV
jgi:hypothetical protein